jgi:hypothetical protein
MAAGWNLSATETAGVVGVGLLMAYGANKVANAMETPASHQAAMLLGGAALYTAGVVIGTNRPQQGWMIPAGSR